MSESGYLSRRALWQHRLSDEVVRGVVDNIRSGVLEPGSSLPPREELMAEFVTMGSVVDQAIAKLIADGTVSRDPDGALRISAVGSPEGFEVPSVDKATLADVIAMLELRIGIEGEAAALAADRRTDDQMAAIHDAARRYEEAASRRSKLAQADYGFHLSVSGASGNHYFHELTDHLGPLFIPRMRAGLSPERYGDMDANLQVSIAEHGAVAEAIAARDGAQARAAMRRHLERSLNLMRQIHRTV
jgi:GntR family transcriptional repressor for pyruvate dehydrogenase complex